MLPPIQTTPWLSLTSSLLTEKERVTSSCHIYTTGITHLAKNCPDLMFRCCAVCFYEMCFAVSGPSVNMKQLCPLIVIMFICLTRTLLWHGSRLSNWVSILSQGLRVAPPEAPVTGYMVTPKFWFYTIICFLLYWILAHANSINRYTLCNMYILCRGNVWIHYWKWNLLFAAVWKRYLFCWHVIKKCQLLFRQSE